MTRRYFDMNQHDALYTVARAYPGGVDALAARMEISPNVLRNKLAPGIATHHASFEEASRVVELCQQAGVPDAEQPLHALLMRHGMAGFSTCAPESSQAPQAHGDLSQAVCKAMAQVGDVAEAVSQALMDGSVSTEEADRIEREFQEALAALGAWRAKVRSLRHPKA